MEWIDIKKRLPERGKLVLVYTKYNDLDLAQLELENDDNDWVDKLEELYIPCVTHWMPLPDKPKI